MEPKAEETNDTWIATTPFPTPGFTWCQSEQETLAKRVAVKQKAVDDALRHGDKLCHILQNIRVGITQKRHQCVSQS